MGNKKLIRVLASGMQTPVQLTFGSFRTRHRFAGAIANQLEIDSLALLNSLTDNEVAKHFGFNEETFPTMFIPDTYEVYWNISLDDFLKRMGKEWQRFWQSKGREEQCKWIGLSRTEVSILASIVDEETAKVDEMPNIASVYLNRLRKGMALQADPTVRYALNSYASNRVLIKHTRVRSPYNTYTRVGLPPGPICIPSPQAIDAVLDYEPHSYLYFCAKADFSGYHTFAKTYAQHLVNAAAYQRALSHRNATKNK
jgi:UPF0755 protein